MTNNCIFCKIASHQLPSKIVYEDEEIMVFHDIHPQAPIHILTIPKKHIARIHDIKESDLQLIGKMIYTAKTQAEKLGVHESGYRMVLNNGRGGGQAVYHIHLHLLGGRQMSWPPG